MSEIKNVCVYLGSSNRCDERHKETTWKMGRMLAEAGITLVYGGGRVGLMGLLADTVIEHGGRVIGIIPSHIEKREIQHTGLTELHVVDSMHIRKQMMVDRSDAFVVLPGGIGTLDELCEIMTWKQLGIHDKPIVMANDHGYWTPFLSMIEHIIAEKFLREEDKRLLQVVSRVEDVIKALNAAPDEAFDPASKWI